MRLNAPRGQKVVYKDHGDPWGGDNPEGLLTSDATYTVEATMVFRSYSFVQLAEFPGREFNTIMFEEVGELLPPVNSVAEIYEQGLYERTGFAPYDPEEDE